MKVDLVRAHDDDRGFIQDLGRLYVYEIARTFGPDPEWAIDRDWLYDADDFGNYWLDGSHAFLIHADSAIAGFCLIDHYSIVPDIDWNMGEFFVLGPYARRGVGRKAAVSAFARFPGFWQVTQAPWNKPAVAFWRRVIGDFTGGRFDERAMTETRRNDEPRNVMTFQSSPPQT